MSTVVVLGAGIAGMEAAIALRRKLGPEHRVAGLGAQLDWDAVPGAAEYGQIICRIDGARRMWDAVRRLEKGTAVLGVMRGIEVRLHTGIRRVEPGRVILADDTAIAADFIMLMPPYRGSRAMLDSPGLSDDRGFVRCDLSLRHPRFPEIFAVGDGVALDVARTGHHAQLQAKVAAQNIASLIAGDVPWAKFRPELFCSLPLGRSRGLLGIWRPSPPSLSNFQLQITYAGRPALWMKVALERYSLWKVR